MSDERAAAIGLLKKIHAAKIDCADMRHDAQMIVNGEVVPYFSLSCIRARLRLIEQRYSVVFDFDSPDAPDVRAVNGRFTACVKTQISVFCLETGVEQAYTTWGFASGEGHGVVGVAADQGVKSWFCRQFLVSDPESVTRAFDGASAAAVVSLATEAQVIAMHGLGVTVPDGMSRVEAARAIAQAQFERGLMSQEELAKKMKQLGGDSEQ